jgi:hypothetical protein
VAAVEAPAPGPGLVQAAVEEVVPAPVPAKLDLARIQGQWPAVCQAAQERSINLAAAADGAALQGFEGGVLSLRVANAYQRQVLETPTEREQLEKLLKELFGEPVRVQVVFAQPQAKAAKGGRPAPEAVERLLKESPEVRKVQELFGAEIVEIREED